MYPNLYYAFKDLFGIDISGLKIINSFGFFVALAFIAAAWILVKELKRKQAQGLLHYTETTVIIGKPAGTGELFLNFILGFVIGFKFLGIFLTHGALDDPQSFIFSGEGNWPAGLLMGGLLVWFKWREKNKLKQGKPEERTVRIWPSDRIGNMTMLAFVAGFIGAKFFDEFENWDRFIKDPIGDLFSPGGLTFYGGLICAGVAIAVYLRKHKIPFIHVADAFAPAMMLAYGIGRMGCQIAGDGDWGVLNSAYVADSTGKAVLASPGQFTSVLTANREYYTSQFGSLDQVHHLSYKAPSFLPDWMVAYTYPHNVLHEGVKFAGCTGNYCSYLPIPVFPTPFYEIIMALLLFFFLWSIRKKIKIPGQLFAIYLIVNGLERFFIEKIRVNTKYDIFGFHPTQAEIISSLLVLSGVVLWIWVRNRGTVTTVAQGHSKK